MSKKYRARKRYNNQYDGPLVIGNPLKKSMLTDNQKDAVSHFDDWFFSHKSKQIWRLGAGSGAGKSFLIRFIIDHYGFDKSNCMVISYTGQSVNVLRSMGVMATTIHKAIMIPVELPVLDRVTREPVIRKGIPLIKVTFRPIKHLPNSIKLIIVDEASFLSVELEHTLAEYGVKIMEVGDPFQLKPIVGAQAFMMSNLDYFMKGVVRQRAGSVLYDVLQKLRHFEDIDVNMYSPFGGDVTFAFARESIEDTFNAYYPFFEEADCIVTTSNRQRQEITELYRNYIIDTDSPYPTSNERLICRQNNWALNIDEYYLTNGTQGRCLNDVGRSNVDFVTETFTMDFKPDVLDPDSDDMFKDLLCDARFIRKPFGKEEDEYAYKRLGEKFEYAHALTAHIVQGATYKRVVFMDSFGRDVEYSMRLRYTAASRAKEHLFYILPHCYYKGFGNYTELANISSKAKSAGIVIPD